MRIAFMTTVGRNVGDEFIREGIRSFFDDAVGTYDPFYVDKHDLATLQRRVLDETHSLHDKFRDADVIVQAGAPVYWNNGGGKYTSHNADWAQMLWYERIFKLGPEKPIFNLGAGAGQKSEDDLPTLMSDPKLIEFARGSGPSLPLDDGARDPLAAQFLQQVGVDHELLPCPAFHAARRVKAAQSGDMLAVNLMPKAGHYRLKPETDESHWRRVIDELLPQLRRDHRLLFVAHDAAEAEFHKQLVRDGESIFLATDYRDYLALYGQVKGIVANRVHGAVSVAGFGRPAVIVGNDARIGIARPIGIPAQDSSETSAEWILSTLQQQFDRAKELRDERIGWREASAKRYIEKIGAFLPVPRPLSQGTVVEDDNGFRFIMRDYMKPYEQVLLKRKSTAGQNRAVAMLIGPNDTVFDVGAHAGRFSVFVSRLPGFGGQIYAFEPVPQTFAMLLENLRLNRVTRISPLQYAICDRPAKVTMNLFPPEFSSWNSMGKPFMLAPGGKRLGPSENVDVTGESIDTFCEKHHIERINFLKVDVEGFEKAVFVGAKRMLQQRRIDRLCFEISRDPLSGAGFTAKQVFEVLEAAGYTVYRFDESQQQFIGPVHDSAENWANYYASYQPLPNSVLTDDQVAAAA